MRLGIDTELGQPPLTSSAVHTNRVAITCCRTQLLTAAAAAIGGTTAGTPTVGRDTDHNRSLASRNNFSNCLRVGYCSMQRSLA